VVTLHVHLRVSDYLAWKRTFDTVMATPAAAAVRSYRIWRGTDEPGLVVCEYTFDSRYLAEGFIYSPSLGRAIEQAAAAGSQTFLEYLQEVAFRSG
jgi:hypothetical protein